MFQLFHTYIARVLSGCCICCKCLIRMLHMFYTYVASVSCDRTAQFIQDQVWLSPLNTLTCAYLHLYKSGSPLSTTKGLNKSTSQPRLYLIKQIHITYIEFTTKIILQYWVQTWFGKNKKALKCLQWPKFEIILLVQMTSSNKSIDKKYIQSSRAHRHLVTTFGRQALHLQQGGIKLWVLNCTQQDLPDRRTK
jgi:hypothetical protein